MGVDSRYDLFGEQEALVSQGPLFERLREAGRGRGAAARYPADESYRRRIARQLNQGENLHALRRVLAYVGESAVRRRHHEQQSEQMWCLTATTNAIVTRTTEYYGLAVTALRRADRPLASDASRMAILEAFVYLAPMPEAGVPIAARRRSIPSAVSGYTA